MRLKKIVLNGFKSFADKTDFEFDNPITAIVGPNGCGKSNVVDAVKWVLGEQSVKSLRSGQMADVIFGGSSSRKPAGSAEVNLLFSNTMGKLPLETDEVQITRRIYKNGESEYLINNKACRLKDIRELFMDTGVGMRAYSIIEQGQVEQLVSASKTDRRAIFEEAAGISKYKAHKKQALRKLESTEQNLLRLADILGELQKQLRSVKHAAGKARNYLQYSQRLKELQVNYSLVEYHKINAESREKNESLAGVQEKFAAIAANLSKNEALMSELGNSIIETENELNRADNHLVTVESNIEKNMQRIEFLQMRIKELEQREKAAQENIKEHKKQLAQLERDSEKYKNEQANGENLLKEKQALLEESEAAARDVNRQCTCLQAELEDEKSGIIDIVRKTAQLHNEIQSIGAYRDNLSNQKDRLVGRASNTKAELEQLLTEKAQHCARLKDIEKVINELNENLNAKKQEADKISDLIASDGKRLAQCKEVRSALTSELKILKDMELKREGLTTAVKNILQNRSAADGKFDYVEGVLADIILVDVEYSIAVEAALEDKTDSLVVSESSRLLADKEAVEKLEGRIHFICMDKTEPFSDRLDLSKEPAVKGRLAEFVRYDGKYSQLVWQLLGKTIVVDSIASAMELSKKTGKEYEFVTLNGEVLAQDGMIKLGPVGETSGLISRKSRLQQLQQNVANIINEISAIEAQIEENNQKAEHISQLCKSLRTAVYEANTEQMQVSSKTDAIEQNINRLKQEQPLIANEIDMLEEQISQSVEKEYNSKQKLQELETVNSQRSERIAQLETQHNEQRLKQQELSQKITDLKVEIGQISEHQQAVKHTLESIQAQIRAGSSTIETAQKEAQNSSQQSEQASRDILKSEAEISELFMEKEKSQLGSRELHDKVEKFLQQQKETEQLIRQQRTEQGEIEQQINALKIELSQMEVKAQNIIQRAQEELQIDLCEAYKNYTEENVNWDMVKNEITELRSKIDRLGNINLDSIEEQDNLEKRSEFLSAQVEDLNSSKGQLQQLINRLNKKSREQFEETFEKIKVNFQEIFRKLFGGGKADIICEEAEDILEAGIEIIARPPGKETRSISLLSGGEKTMTAIALLFAIFKTKPSPFCFLDEVDAALDEANIERFNLMVSEFSKNSQFIMITHSKRTMSIADVLFGITMQIRGVSKKISVRFDQFDQFDQAEQTAAVA